MARRVDQPDVTAWSRRESPSLGVIPAALLLFAVAPSVRAQEPVERMFSLSGFGTLGVVHSSEGNADFVSNIFVPDGAGFSGSLSPEVDSRLGAQVVGNFTPRLSATVQLIAEQSHDGHYWPQVEWANLKYQFTPQFSVRVGRTALASFLASDFRKVGYANPWVRPPQEVYGLVPLASADGVDANYELQLGEVVHSLHVDFGQTDIRSADGNRIEARDFWTISDTIEYGPATLRILYQQAVLSVSAMHALIGSFRQFGPQGVALADRYDPDGKRVSFVGVGGMYDPGDWFVMAEWGNVNFRSALGRRTAWYVSGGYRIHQFTPYVAYAEAAVDSDRTDPGLSLTGLPPQLAAPAAALNGGLNAILRIAPVQRTITAGARWDFMRNVALKVQYDHLELGAGSSGALARFTLQPGFQPGGSVNLLSATIDFVW